MAKPKSHVKLSSQLETIIAKHIRHFGATSEHKNYAGDKTTKGKVVDDMSSDFIVGSFCIN